MSAPKGYEQKFAEFIRMCVEAQRSDIDAVLIHHPEALGDDYAEVIESLNRLSAAGLKLGILPPGKRGGGNG